MRRIREKVWWVMILIVRERNMLQSRRGLILDNCPGGTSHDVFYVPDTRGNWFMNTDPLAV